MLCYVNVTSLEVVGIVQCENNDNDRTEDCANFNFTRRMVCVDDDDDTTTNVYCCE